VCTIHKLSCYWINTTGMTHLKVQKWNLSNVHNTLQLVPHRERTPSPLCKPITSFLFRDPVSICFENQIKQPCKFGQNTAKVARSYGSVIKVMNTKCTVDWEVSMHHVGTSFYSSILRYIPSLRTDYHSYSLTSYWSQWKRDVRWIQAVSKHLNCNPTKAV
jgi:hypothetical protein